MRGRGKRGERGAAAVEFALVLPLLVVVLFGIVEFGLVFYNQQMLTNASREGARAGIVAGNPRVTAAAVQAVVANYCNAHLVSFGVGSLSTTVTAVSAANGAAVDTSAALFGDDLTVRVQYPYQFLVLPNFVVGLTGTLNLSAQTVMRYE